MRTKVWLTAAASAAAAALLLAGAPDASATVSAAPATWTPQVTSPDATVRQIVACGNKMYAVGDFSEVTQGGKTYVRHNAFSFNANNGKLTGWQPAPNGVVNSIAVTNACKVAYLGGQFSAVGSTKVSNLVQVDSVRGRVAASFAHTVNGEVNTLALANADRELMVGGAFTTLNGTAKAYYASVSPATGRVDGYFPGAVSGLLPGSGRTFVYNQQVSPSGGRLLLEGTFTAVNGVAHQQIAELDLSATAATLDPWSNAQLNTTTCNDDLRFYVRDATFSPDGATIYLGTTGGGDQGNSPFCDSGVALANTPAATVKWINKTGRDSLYSVAAGPNDVYLGGHQRWADNPLGANTCGPGCVVREGIADISTSTGLATSWNPGRSRGVGADDLLITPGGLWVASDTLFGSVTCAGQYHPGICFFPGAA